jgi:hypothetical protein
MSLYDWWKMKNEPSEQERLRQEKNQRIYNMMTGSIAKETDENMEEFNKFVSDLAVYTSFYESVDPSMVQRSQLEQEMKEQQAQSRQESYDFINKMLDNSGGLTENQKKLRKDLGPLAPIIGFDLETGNLVSRDMDPQQAFDQASYGRFNQLALTSVETPSIYRTTRLYTIGEQYFGVLEKENPELFPRLTPEEEAFRRRATVYDSPWSNWTKILDYIPFVDNRREGMEDVDTNLFLFENIRALFGEEGILPTQVFGEQKQEGWDAAKAWELMKEYHPDISSYLVNVAGVNVEQLLRTPNHWEFRYAINEAVDMSNIQAILSSRARDQNWLENKVDFAKQFVIQSFRSADMPVELALTLASAGGYAGVGAAVTLSRASKARSLSRGVYSAARMADNARDLANATKRTNSLLQNLRTYQALMVPSNWGSIITNSILSRKLAVEGVQWGSEVTAGKFMTSVFTDFGQGLVEGALYNIQNQITDNMEWSSGRLWSEMLEEGVGQIVFGKVFRGINLGLGQAIEGIGADQIGPALWDKATRKIDPALKQMIELQAKLNVKDVPIEVIQETYFNAFLQLHQHFAWQQMTGDKSMPLSVIRLQSALQRQAAKKGVNIDLNSIISSVFDSVPEGVQLTTEEAAILIHTHTVDRLRERNIRVDDEDMKALHRAISIEFIMRNKLEEKGISETDLMRLASTDIDAFKELIQDTYEEISADPEAITEAAERITEIYKSAREKTNLPDLKIDLNSQNENAQALEFLDIFRDDDGIVDTELAKEGIAMVENLNSNIHKGVFSTVQRLIEEREIAQASRSAAEAPAEAPAEAVEAPAEAPAEAPTEAAPKAPDPEEATLEDFMNWEDQNRYTIAQIDKAVKDGIITELRGEMIKRAIVKLRGKGDAERTDFFINFASGNVVGAKEIFTDSVAQLDAIARWTEGVKTPEQIARETARAPAEAVAETAEAPAEAPNPPLSEQAEGTPTPPPAPVDEGVTEPPKPIDLTDPNKQPQSDLDQFIAEQIKANDCL